MVKFSVLTIFPEMILSFLNFGIVKRAIEQNKISVKAVNIRDFTKDKHKTTDDAPYGGGSGMVMKPEPLFKALYDCKKENQNLKTILLSPQGKVFNQNIAYEFSLCEGFILICGRYEGIDERICQSYVDYEVSIGDYILTGGELASMVIIDSVTRLIKGTLGGEDSAQKDSFSNCSNGLTEGLKGLLEYAHYTRPKIFEEQEVPEVLLSGNHKEIENWRLESSLIRTFLKRPDLLEERNFTKTELEILKKWHYKLGNITKNK